MHEVLIMAMTRMLSGICTAGYINEPHTESGLRWVRPVKEFGSLLLGDMTDAAGRVVQMGDVVALALLQPRPDPTHTEDWLTDFVRRRPHLLRRLTGEKRAGFLAKHVDRAPDDVLQRQSRSLCLVRPAAVWATFFQDSYSGKYEARLGFRLDGLAHQRANSAQGIPVTDLKWRALGRAWLASNEPTAAGKRPTKQLSLEHSALQERLNVETIYLSIGLSRPHRDKMWALVVGVHPVPDYTAAIDYDNL